MRKYWTLFTREDDAKWYPQFGDYSASCVNEERQSYRNEYAAKDLRIISHADNLSLEELMKLANED